jgi:hypothetical protein
VWRNSEWRNGFPQAVRGAESGRQPRQRRRKKQRRVDATGQAQSRLRRQPTRARNRTETSQAARGNANPWQSKPRARLVARCTMRMSTLAWR